MKICKFQELWVILPKPLLFWLSSSVGPPSLPLISFNFLVFSFINLFPKIKLYILGVARTL